MPTSQPTQNSATHATSAPPLSPRAAWFGVVGDLVCRVIIPLWLIAGAGFKLAERNPNLLPQPVLKQIYALHDLLKVGTTEQFLEAGMRAIIGVEFVLAAGMILLPRLSRWLCLATLGLFIAILGSLVAQGAASCGCFGASGPPPKAVLAIDSVLFVLAAIFGPSRRHGTLIGFAVISVIGLALAFGVPAKSLHFDTPQDAMPPALPEGSGAPAEGAGTTPPSDAGSGATKPADADAPPSDSAKTDAAPTPPPAPAATAWPPVPAKPKGFYAPRFNTWVGQRLSAQEMMHMLKRPLPEGLDTGKWHIIFYRPDCDHCAELLDNFFAGKLATRTLLVKVPDATPGRAIPNRATDVVRSELLRVGNGPDYVIGTPIVLTVVDGVVKAFCDKPAEDPDALMATLEAE